MEGRDGTIASPNTRPYSCNDDPHHLHHQQQQQQQQETAPFHHDDDDEEEEDEEEENNEAMPNNNNHHHLSYHALYNHEGAATKPLVVEVADQLKEKLTIKNSNHPINGCVLGRENGLTKLDRLEHQQQQEESSPLQPSVHANNRQTSTAGDVTNKPLPDDDNNHQHQCLVVNCEKRDSTKDDAYPQVHGAGVKSDANVIEGPSLTLVQKNSSAPSTPPDGSIAYVGYESELQMPDIMRLIQKDLSEPYSIYTYRYFIHNWPKLCFLAMDEEKCVGAVVCKLDLHKNILRRGYIAMLAVDEKYRKRKIGSNLVLKAIRAMVADDADEVVLETEITNKPALRLYENLGFVRDKRLFRYYLNGVDALRLKLWLR